MDPGCNIGIADEEPLAPAAAFEESSRPLPHAAQQISDKRGYQTFAD
jgi:hypothetical protein